MIRLHPSLAALAAAAGLAACAMSGASPVAAPPVDSAAARFVPPEIEGKLAASDLAGAVTVAKWEGELDEVSYRAKPVE